MTTIKSLVSAVLSIVMGAGAILCTSDAHATNASLTVIRTGTGSGTVTSDVGAIDCGAMCSDNYAIGTPVVLTVTPAVGSQFTGWLGPCTGAGTCQFTINGTTNAVATFAPASLGAPTLDIDGTGTYAAMTDGLLVIRYLFGLSGPALIAGAVGPGAARATDTDILSYLTDIRPILDIDGNGQVDALTDGLLIFRYLSGLRGANLISGVVGPGATRTAFADIEASLSAVVSTAGTGLPPDPATVAPPVDPTVATSIPSATDFLYTGANPIQTGVAPGTIEARRAAVLRGTVHTRDGGVLPGVTIAILAHLEFGQTKSRADGAFDLAVNGGGLLTVNYQKTGFLPVQRQVNAPWQNYATLPDVVMIPLDAQVTTVDLNAATMQVARGSPVSDADGARRATVLFPPGTTATMVMPNGTTQPMTTFNVRATEYTVGPSGPNAMPGGLPPASGYTYAVELSADEALSAGATSIQFNQPVPFYVENFVGFPVGSLVPVGFYDRGQGQWMPLNNGRVIAVLAITNGLADLDLDGDGVADGAAALAALGITDAERQRLASLYLPGTQLWRVLLPHFSPFDYNWPYGPSPDSQPPNWSNPKPGPKPDKPPKDGPDRDCGSIIGCEPQTLGEAINVTGTSLSLHYQSDRVPGRRTTRILKVRLSGATLPLNLQRIHLEIAIAGRTFESSYAPQANLFYTFTWDGKDAYNRSVQGQQPAKVRIGYEYVAQYYATPDAAAASYNRFGSPPNATAAGGGGGAVTFSRPPARTTSPPIILWQDYDAVLGSLDKSDLGGWSLRVHHTYDFGGRTLFLGNGDQRSAAAIGAVITTAAGTGSAGFTDDGGPATQAQLYYPEGVTAGSDGSLYIADTQNHRIRRVAPDGIITTVAGTGVPGFAGDGGPATQARLNTPEGVTVGSNGNLYIADTGNHRIRRVRPDGIITTVAGTGAYGFAGDGGPAIQAWLGGIRGVAAAPDGSVYITDTSSNHNSIRRVGPDGIITTVAGTTGASGFAGDGGLATLARLSASDGVAVRSDGSLYVADTFNHRIRRVGPDGIITTVAGTGASGFAGDGGPATQARLNVPTGVAVGSDGSLYIADAFNQRIRRVGPDGTITTVAGTDPGGFAGDGGPATGALLANPQGVAIGPDGSLYIADVANNRVRQIRPSLPGLSIGDTFIAADDGSELYVFNSTGRHLRTLDALTGAVRFQFTYDSGGRLASISDGDGNVTTVERDGSGNASAIVAPFGQRTTLALNGDGYLATVTNPAAEAVHLTYNSGDADGLLATLSDPRGNVHHYSYDVQGRLVRDESPAGGVKNLARTDIAEGHYAVTVTTGMGLVTTHEIEELSTGDTRRVRIEASGARTESLIRPDGSRLVTYPDGTLVNLVEGPDPRFGMQAPILASLTVTTPGGIATSRSATRTATLSDPNNLLSLITQTDTVTVDGRTSTSVYQAASKTFTMTSPAGRQTSVTLDTAGRVVRRQIATLEPASYTYDTHGRIIDVSVGVGPASRSNQINYNGAGRVAGRSDPMGRSASYVYDAAERITSQTLTDGSTVAFAYDANGNMSSLTPPGRTAHAFGYTAVDLEASYTPPILPGGPTITSRTFDADRRLTHITRPDGATADLAYNAAGQLGSLTLPVGVLSRSYDDAGRMVSITAPGGLGLAYGYDGGLLTTSTASGTVSGSVGRAYDTSFRLSTLSLNGADPISFAYDGDNLLTQAGSLSLSRDSHTGLLTTTTLGVTNDSRTYNGFAELTAYTAYANGTAQLSAQYTRDALGRQTSTMVTVGGVSDTYAYIYDAAGRLTGVQKNGAAMEGYTYDANGNRLSATDPSGTRTGVYDAQDRLTQYGATTYTYTSAGELASKSTGAQNTAYSYDPLGNLRSATLPGGAAITYLVDGRNRRIGKRVNGSLVQGFLYENGLRPIAETDGAGSPVTRFVYASHDNVPDYLIKGGVTYRIVTDQLGSPRLVVNTTTGAIAQQMDYDSFGKVLADTNPGFQPFGFGGGLYDRDTKLVRFGLRDYDAETGRWTAKDPIGFAGGQANLYAYVQSDPLNASDASGLCKGDYKKCRDAFLNNYFGELAHGFADLTSFQSAIGQNGKDVQNEFLSGFFEVSAVKGVPTELVKYSGKYLAEIGSASARVVGANVAEYAELFAAASAIFGIGIFAVTTTMDALATYECWNQQF